MEKKPITSFLKIMAIIYLIVYGVGVLGSIATNAFVLSSGMSVGGFYWVSSVVSVVCGIVNFVIAIMALQHKNIGLVYKISVVTLIFAVVFDAVSIIPTGGFIGIITLVIRALIPVLFVYAAFKQNKYDMGE